MKLLKIFIVSLLMLSTGLYAGVATVTAVKGSAFIQRGGTDIEATLGASLEQRDTIKTKDNTKVQVIFTDETIISIGKNSEFSIKEYLFDDTQEPVARFGILKGAMRTITGKIGKIAPQKFSVETKTATIGIRGTNFSVIANEDGSINVYCTYGAISVQVDGQETIVNQGYYIQVSISGEKKVLSFTSKELKEMRNKSFGLNKPASSTVPPEGEMTQEDGATQEQLNLTVNDQSIIIGSVEETSSQSIISSINVFNEILSSYTMSNASYSGSVTVTNSGGSSSLSSGDLAELNVDFGADTLTLDLGNSTGIFSTNPNFSGNGFTVSGTNNVGTASGTFQEPTGDQVLGNFRFDDGDGSFDEGTFDVSTATRIVPQ